MDPVQQSGSCKRSHGNGVVLPSGLGAQSESDFHLRLLLSAVLKRPWSEKNTQDQSRYEHSSKALTPWHTVKHRFTRIRF